MRKHLIGVMPQPCEVDTRVERQLFPEEQVLSNQRGSGTEGDLYTSKRLNEEAAGDGEKAVMELRIVAESRERDLAIDTANGHVQDLWKIWTIQKRFKR